MPKLINGDSVFVKITEIMDGCRARNFKSAEDANVARDMLKACAQVIIDAPEESLPQVVRCQQCKQWGRIPNRADTQFAKMCAVGGYMTGPNGYCHFGKEDGNAHKNE